MHACGSSQGESCKCLAHTADIREASVYIHDYIGVAGCCTLSRGGGPTWATAAATRVLHEPPLPSTEPHAILALSRDDSGAANITRVRERERGRETGLTSVTRRVYIVYAEKLYSLSLFATSSRRNSLPVTRSEEEEGRNSYIYTAGWLLLYTLFLLYSLYPFFFCSYYFSSEGAYF